MLCLFVFYFREIADDDGEEDDEGVHLEQNPSSESADVDYNPRDEDDGEEDELAEYDLDKYDEEDTGEECNICSSYSSYMFEPPVEFAKCLVEADMLCLSAVASNLGDSLAGLTVFSSNEEDPYVTIKDTVSCS